MVSTPGRCDVSSNVSGQLNLLEDVTQEIFENFLTQSAEFSNFMENAFNLAQHHVESQGRELSELSDLVKSLGDTSTGSVIQRVYDASKNNLCRQRRDVLRQRDVKNKLCANMLTSRFGIYCQLLRVLRDSTGIREKYSQVISSNSVLQR